MLLLRLTAGVTDIDFTPPLTLGLADRPDIIMTSIFWEVTDNISETVQGRDIVAMED